jgi:hypothetical protein
MSYTVADHYPPEPTHYRQLSILFLQVQKLEEANGTESPRITLACVVLQPAFRV